MTYEQQTVHCLECDYTYPEQRPVVKICPYCGNDDMMHTVYLQEDDTEDN